MNVIYKFENCLVNILETVNKHNEDFKNATDHFGQILTANECLGLYTKLYKLYPNNDEMLHQLNRDANIYLFSYFDLDVVRNILTNLNCINYFSGIIKVNYFEESLFAATIKQLGAKHFSEDQLSYYVGDQSNDCRVAEYLNFKFIHARWSDYADKSTFLNSIMSCRDGYDLVDIL